MDKTIMFTLTGISWVLVTAQPTIFIGISVILTLWSLDLIIYDNRN